MTCPFLLQEAIFSKKNPINLPLRDGPNGAQALAASGGEGRKHSANVHFSRLQGKPLTPMPPAGGNFSAALPESECKNRVRPYCQTRSQRTALKRFRQQWMI